jgi:hypothetical protein
VAGPVTTVKPLPGVFVKFKLARYAAIELSRLGRPVNVVAAVPSVAALVAAVLVAAVLVDVVSVVGKFVMF